MYVEGEIPASVNTGSNYYPYPMYNSGFGFGNGFDGIWGLLAIAIVFGGFGGGFGWGNNNGGHVYDATNNIESSIHSALDTLQITNKLDGITTDLNTDFGNVINAITTNGYESRLAMNDLGYQMQNCCCEGRATINQVGTQLSSQLADLKYTLATEECATRQASADNTQRIIDFLTQDKLAQLTSENVALKGELSQATQTSQIINALRPTPVPSYPATNLYGFYGNGCGGYNGQSIQ